MRRKQFEKITPEFEDCKGLKSHNYAIGAFVKDDILAIDFYEMNNGVWKAIWRTLINEKEFCNFDFEGKYWNEKYIDNFAHEKSWGAIDKFLDNAKKTIEEFLKGVGGWIYSDIITSIQHKENQIAEKKRETAAERKFRRIQEKIQEAPPVPKDFRKFIMDKVFKHDHFMYYTKAEAHCSRCGSSTHKTKEMKHNAEGKCPNCKKYVKYKSIGRMSEHDERKEVMLIQKHNNDVILRYFKCSLLSECGHAESLQYTESVRTYHDKKIEWYRARYVHYVDMWGHSYWDDKMDAYHQVAYGTKTVLYSGNWEDIKDLHDTIKYFPVQELSEEGTTLPWKDILRGQPLKNAIFEKLYKAGLKKLAVEYIRTHMETNYRERDLKKLLMITKPMLEYMKNNDSGKEVLKVFQDAKRDNYGLNDAEIFELAEAGIKVSELKNVAEGNKIIKLFHYLQKSTGYSNLKATYSHYADYISMIKDMDYCMDRDTVRYPKDLKAAHDKAVAEFYQEETDKRNKEVLKKYPQIRKMEAELNEKYGFQNENYIIIAPKSAADIVEEGRTLHHCVGGDNYLNKHNSGINFIFFLRKAATPEERYYTIELNPKNNSIVQYYGYNDRKPDKKKVDVVLEKWKKYLKRKENRAKVAVAG